MHIATAKPARRIAAAACCCAFGILLLAAPAALADTGADTSTDTTQQEQTTTANKKLSLSLTSSRVLVKNSKEYVYLNGNKEAKKKVTWKSSSKKVKIVKKTKTYCIVKGVKKGKATITAKCDGQKKKCKVTVMKKGNAYVKAWAKNIVKTEIKPYYKGHVMRLAAASAYVTFGYGHFTYKYGMKSTADVIAKKKGTCTTAGRVVIELCKALGYKNAKLRFAANDNTKRYTGGKTTFYVGSDHHNIKVKAGGKTYYIDGTPEFDCVYVSTSKKPVFLQVSNIRLI